jgi:hypothetical protein
MLLLPSVGRQLSLMLGEFFSSAFRSAIKHLAAR